MGMGPLASKVLDECWLEHGRGQLYGHHLRLRCSNSKRGLGFADQIPGSPRAFPGSLDPDAERSGFDGKVVCMPEKKRKKRPLFRAKPPDEAAFSREKLRFSGGCIYYSVHGERLSCC